MSVQYRNLLPSSIRETRWGTLIDTFQSLIATIKEEKIDIIKNQYNIEEMTSTEISNLAYMLGFNLTILNGYTSTDDYLKKEICTITNRINWKNTKTGYIIIGYIFNLIINTFPIRYLLSTEWEVLDEYWDEDFLPTTIEEFTLDFSSPLYLDSGTISTLDSTTAVYNRILRHFIIQYEPKYIETATEFFTTLTMKAFRNDVLQMKRTTEIPYFEFLIKIVANVDGTQTDRIWLSYDDTYSYTQRSKLFETDLSNVDNIQIGNGSITDLTSAPTGVNSLVTTIASASLDAIELNYSMRFHSRRFPTEFCTFYTFTEIALMNSSGDVIFYSNFPVVQWNSEMYANVAFNITLE